MGFIQKRKYSSVLLIVLTILSASRFQQLEAMRTLDGDGLLWLQALPRGHPPPSGSNPCTYISGQKKDGPCTLKEMNVAAHGGSSGHHVAAPPAYPGFIIEVGAAAAAVAASVP
ncbi:hypothetical protein Nepgr_004201 [Nepenthes gracilis]|uniref:Uncharacterized protein n=1 Tax=Nepenthes gracilis TaxID=150966 RepID=A0AAD3S131_NEPGR|nr:hypothetical protein Nepgr_004201 [Nepenthes gracilis]